ncbi:hypothetical protein R1sor_021828 [Riccia sorocarpa]|uniref:Uncharacterized protein n=1 Tax=Riccia sorocarpa TaxID=122646 RepID=A0ABD3GI36_9MARC
MEPREVMEFEDGGTGVGSSDMGTEKRDPNVSSPTFNGMVKERNLKKGEGEVDDRNSRVAAPEEDSKGKTRKNTKEMVGFFKLFAFADSFDIVLMIVGTIAGLVAGVSQPFMTFLFGRFVDAFGNNGSNTDKLQDEVNKVAILYVVVGAVAAAAASLEVAGWMITGERQSSRIRGLYLKAILRQDISFFDTEVSSGDVISRMSDDTVLIQEAMGEKVGNAVQLLGRFAGGFIIAFTKSWKLTVVLVAVIPVLAFVGGFMSSNITKITVQGQQAYSNAGSIVEQVLGAIRTVASYSGEEKAVEAYDKELVKAERAGVKQGLAVGLAAGATMFVMFSTYALALWYGSRLVASREVTAGDVIIVIFAVVMGGMALGQLSPAVTSIVVGRAAAYKMFQVIHRKSQIDALDLSGLIPEAVKGDLELRHVTFAYPTRPEINIFSGFNLFIPSGTTAALVGESGSGKSSVVSLVERFYDPQAGEVLLDGVDVKTLQLKWLRQQIALVSQEPVLFSTSIMENISYGKDGATLEEVQAAAKAANAATFINKLPQGYETQVGERGTQLSGGQKQRIAIARAIIKDPRILLLDEATSALDADSERLVQEALDRVIINRTTVIVAHRLSTIRNADMIAVIRNGTILESGTHEELIKNPEGGYNQLISLQATQQAEVEARLESRKSNYTDTIGEPLEEEQNQARGSFSILSRILSRGHSMDGRARISSSSRRSGSRKISMDVNDLEAGKLAAGADEDDETSKEGPQGSVWRLAKMNNPEAPYLVLGSLGAIGQGLILPMFGFLLSNVIQFLFKSPHDIRREGKFWSLMFLALSGTTLIANPVQRFCFAKAGSALVRRVRRRTFNQVLRQEIGWFDDDRHNSGTISGRLYLDAGAVRAVVGDTLALLVQNTASIVAGLAIAFTGGWELALVVIGLVPLLGMQGAIIGKRLKGFSKSAKSNYEKATRVANDAVTNIRTVASFGAEEKVVNFHEEQCKYSRKIGVKQGLVSGASIAVATFVLFAAYAMGFWAGSKLVALGRMNFEGVFRVFLAIATSAIAVSQSLTLAPDVAKAQNAVGSIFRILDRKSNIDPMEKTGKTLEDLTGLIEFQRVHFRYPARPDITVLRDLSFVVPAGQTLALVGESGSGKSTVISLLERFYDPDSGSILIDETEIRTLQLEWLRKKIGLVSQEPVLFDGTIKMNIIYGKEGAVSEEEIEIASSSANAHKFISKLPNGYETRVGERGIQLSGGQKQRVAIARAIIKDPRILLLDEATSALDAESEQIVQEALDRISLSRTTIVVAHRLSTVRNADQIAVMKNGSLVERGTYDQLISTPGSAFSALVKLSKA